MLQTRRRGGWGNVLGKGGVEENCFASSGFVRGWNRLNRPPAVFVLTLTLSKAGTVVLKSTLGINVCAWRGNLCGRAYPRLFMGFKQTRPRWVEHLPCPPPSSNPPELQHSPLVLPIPVASLHSSLPSRAHLFPISHNSFLRTMRFVLGALTVLAFRHLSDFRARGVGTSQPTASASTNVDDSA